MFPLCISAVRGISFGLKSGERFGLLGVNGAGKSTTLNILTGDIPPSSGQAFIAGYSLLDESTKRYIGYCPQTDPLLDLLNAYETLWFYGSIRCSMTPSVLTRRVHTLIEEVGLTPYAQRPCGTYSGGNKRKLSLALALIGDPKVLFLDEPSTGMDPEARRAMWDIIAKISTSRSVVLTTHSMEESEALCTRIGIMTAGRFRCIGSSQYIKSKFGAEYQIEIRTISAELLGICIADMKCEDVLPSDTLEDERHESFVRLRTQSKSRAKLDQVSSHENVASTLDQYFDTIGQTQAGTAFDLAKVFSYIEENKERFGIVSYSVSQATLEQIFIQVYIYCMNIVFYASLFFISPFISLH
jgi:ABC-type multidrug transport system ATPase subunit